MTQISTPHAEPAFTCSSCDRPVHTPLGRGTGWRHKDTGSYFCVCVCNVGVQECPEHPGRLWTQEQKIAHRKAFDAKVTDYTRRVKAEALREAADQFLSQGTHLEEGKVVKRLRGLADAAPAEADDGR